MRLPASPHRLLLLGLLLSIRLCAEPAADATLAQAAAAIGQRQYLAAERLVEPIAKAKRPPATALYLLSQIRAAQHQLPEAIKLAERAAKAEPDNARFHAQVGAVYAIKMKGTIGLERSGAAGSLRKAYERALKLDAACIPALTGLAEFYLSAPPEAGGDLARGGEMIERLSPLDPAQAEILRGGLAMRRLDFAAALGHFDRATDLLPHDPVPPFSAGLALLQLRRPEESRARFEAALKRDSSYSPARQALAALDQPDATGPRP